MNKQVIVASLLVSLLSIANRTTAFEETKQAGAVAEITWNTGAEEHEGQIGQTFNYRCPANGRIGSIYGTDFYTIDSSICTAAVHAGLITVPAGGVVAIQIQPNEERFYSTTRNGVTSQRWWSSWGTYAFIDRNSGALIADRNVRTIDWRTDASHHRGQLDQEFSYRCLPNGAIGTVYGTDVYTADDSSLCTAAVHAGLITVANGGTFTIRIVPEQSTFAGTTRNGVTTQRWSGGSWPAFRFVR